MRRLNRPDFEGWGEGTWINPDVLPMDLKQRLWQCFPSRWSWSSKADVLFLVGEGVQSAEAFFEENASAVRAAQLRRVQDKARELLQALAAMSPETALGLDAHILYLVAGSDPPERLSEFTESARREMETMARWWDAVQDIEVSTAYAAEQEKPGKLDRPTVRNAKRVVFFAADAVYRIRGALPPRGKGTWFPVFARELGSGFGLKCGPELVDSVVGKMVAEGRHPKRPLKELHPGHRLGFVPPVSSPD